MPTVSSVAITSDPGGDLTYQVSDVIQLTATFSEAVTVDTTGGTPRIPFTLGSGDEARELHERQRDRPS